MNTKFMFKYISIIFFMILCSKSANSQSVISFSANGGLAKGNKNYGAAFKANAGLEFKKVIINTSYVYTELNNINNDLSFNLNKYSITAGYIISSYEKKFKFYGNIGPSLLIYNSVNNIDNELGIDLGLTLSCNLFNTLNFEMGIENTFNDTTSNLVQTFFGFRYYLFENKY